MRKTFQAPHVIVAGRTRPLVEPLEQRIQFTVPAGFVDLQVTGALDHPVAFDFAPDGRIFVAEQGGALRVIKDGVLLSTPFATFDVSSSGERGVLGVTVDPDFTNNGYVYVYYTSKTPVLHNRVARLTANGDVAAPGSQTTIFDLDPLGDASTHNGGAIHFGTDGKLYIAAGENSRPSLAQSLGSTLGKVLRVNPDGSIPSDNPFVSTPGASGAIWALGFRNPFTFDIHRTTGQTYVNDVGQATWEEIDAGAPGANFGWPTTEGPTDDPVFHAPLYTYNHNTGNPTGCSIVGGTFYDPLVSQFPSDFSDDYLFSDGCNQWIWRLDGATGQVSEFATGVGPAFNLQTGPDGSLYYVVYNSGLMRKISYLASDTAPAIIVQPTAASVAAGRPATFRVEAAGKEPLSYRWQRDGVDIPGATADTYTLDATAAGDQGATFRVVVSNALGSATSQGAPLNVILDAPPAPIITSPKEGAFYKGGQKIKFSGRATDPEDGKLPKSAFTWEVVFHHDDHTHPFLAATTGVASGTFVIPREGETSTNVWYRVQLTVADSQGVTQEVTRDIHPRTAVVHVVPNVPGAQLSLDGQPMNGAFDFTSVVGMRRTLSAASQVVDGVGYDFRKWSGGRGDAIVITTPAKDRTYKATFIPTDDG